MKTGDLVIPQALGRSPGACICLGFYVDWNGRRYAWILMPDCYVTRFYVDSLVLA
jgi:hypothetical protein